MIYAVNYFLNRAEINLTLNSHYEELDLRRVNRNFKSNLSANFHSVVSLMQTAEMPGFYAEGEYDISGFAVGIVKKSDVIDGKSITEGDVILGFPSSGVHSNGFSLARRYLCFPSWLLFVSYF